MYVTRRTGGHPVRVPLVRATLTRDVWCRVRHARTHQLLQTGTLPAGATVYVEQPERHAHPFADTPAELAATYDVVYDEFGMQCEIAHPDWSALNFDPKG